MKKNTVIKTLIILSASLCLVLTSSATPSRTQAAALQTGPDGTSAETKTTRWTLADGGRTIVWRPSDDIPHYDHVEMTGEKVSMVLRWGVDADGAFRCERSLVFPTLRRIPNDTHASLVWRTAADIPSTLSVEGMSLDREKVTEVRFDGIMTVKSLWNVGWTRSGADRKAGYEPEIEMVRTFFPSSGKLLTCERYELVNIGKRAFEVNIPEYCCRYVTDPAKGKDGSYYVRGGIAGTGNYYLAPGGRISFDVFFQAGKTTDSVIAPDSGAEYSARRSFIDDSIAPALVLETPDSILNSEFHFSKLRACESIIRTKNGYMHAPGGEVFYAAMWTNDQCEYVNPFFPFVGYGKGNLSAENSYRLFGGFMNEDYRPIPSSIIAEGDDIWAGAGDRGDAAMIACGASRYALARGSVETARELWPLIEWCLEYCRRQKTADGVVASDTDELEGRFPSGDANLSTSCLYYDALLSAAYLAESMGLPRDISRECRAEAGRMKTAIEKYFGAEVSGYETYRYYEGNDVLRSWICLPLVVGLDYHREGTAAALLGPELMTRNGLLTAQGDSTFWDRSTLYALRGLFCAGYPDEAYAFMHDFSVRRLLGDHVPYMIEAWPEGEQRHLSAESGLYCRIVTEGIFGIRPTGLDSFDMTPSMPSGWDRMALRHIKAFGRDFDISVHRLPSGSLEVFVTGLGISPQRHIVREGGTLKIVL